MEGGGHLSKVPVPLKSSIQKVFDMNIDLATTFLRVGLHKALPGHCRANHEGQCLSWLSLFTSCYCHLGEGQSSFNTQVRDRTSIQIPAHGAGDSPPVLLQQGCELRAACAVGALLLNIL